MLEFNSMTDLPLAKVGLYQKDALVEAVRIDEPFAIMTWVRGSLETQMLGDKGDYVCIGAEGEIWRVQKDIFEKTYKPVCTAYIKSRHDAIVSSAKYVFNGFFKIIEATFTYIKNNGEWSEEQTHLIFERGDSVAMVVHNTTHDTINLVRQFRVATLHKSGGWIDELPAGIIQNGESSWMSVYRELKEELGYVVSPEIMEYIHCFYVSPGGTSERIWLWYVPVTDADKTEAGGGLSAEGEDIALVSVPVHQIRTMLDYGNIGDAKTVIGLQWFLYNKGDAVDE